MNATHHYKIYTRLCIDPNPCLDIFSDLQDDRVAVVGERCAQAAGTRALGGMTYIGCNIEACENNAKSECK